MEPWYKIVTPRKEVREGRSFNPDEFAIHLEQVVAGNAPEDYQDPGHFFARTCFTRALCEHAGMVLRRLSGQTMNTAPVMTLITQFGGGKTHTLTALYHMVTGGAKAVKYSGISELMKSEGIKTLPNAKVAAFIGNAWDPQEGRETPWIDIAYQLAGDRGVKALGPACKTTPPGTEVLGKVFAAANAPVLLLFDEVLNFLNRHRSMAESFHAFIQNLTVATTGTSRGVAVISLPRSQVEMTDWDMQWQEKITRVVRRVARDLIVNDETEISEVVRRRLFEDIGNDRARKKICKAYADWCFERRAQLPPEWTIVDSCLTEAKAREYLLERFEVCYPFHPATLSVFQRKWQALSQYQQTRGTLAMLARWICLAQTEAYKRDDKSSLITLGSAPLHDPGFRSVVLGQLGESRLIAAIDADLSGTQSHAWALDADTKGALKDIHRRVGVAILFESSGGQTSKIAHLPELRAALGEPELDTTSIDNAAFALEDKSYFIMRVGSDGFRIRSQPTMKKVASDRKASLDEESDIKPALRNMIQNEFNRGATIPMMFFPSDSTSVQDSPKLTLVIMDPNSEWTGSGPFRNQIEEWTRQRGKTSRLYPGSLIWCLKKPGRCLREKIESWLAWRRVATEGEQGLLGEEFDRIEAKSKVSSALDDARDEVWGDYRFVVIADNNEPDGLKTIDLGAGHSSGNETLCGRVISAMKSQGLLNESVGASYIERNWPPALKESGAWPLASLRQSFLNGSLTRLIDPDSILRSRIVDFVSRGEFGLASGLQSDGGYERVLFNEYTDPADVIFESGVFLLLKNKAMSFKAMPEPVPSPGMPAWESIPAPKPETGFDLGPEPKPPPSPAGKTFRIYGNVSPEIWNRLGTKILPKLRSGSDLKIGIEFSVTLVQEMSKGFESDLKQILEDLGLSGKVRIE
jgi:hypothetical protein